MRHKKHKTVSLNMPMDQMMHDDEEMKKKMKREQKKHKGKM